MSGPLHTSVPAPKAPGHQSRRRVSKPHDASEREADRAADVVGRGGSVSGWSFSSTPSADAGAVHREDKAKAPTDEDKYKQGATKVGEALLETKAGKDLKDKVLDAPPVKAVRKAATSPAGIATGIGVGAAGLGVLAATGSPLPAQLPKVPLDVIHPGLSAKVTWKGPVNAPTEGGIVLTFTEQGPKGSAKKAAQRRRDQWEREGAELRAFQAGLTTEPGAKDAEEARQTEEAIAFVVAKNARQPGLFVPFDPAKKPEAAPAHEKPADPKSAESAAPTEQKRDDAPVQREATTTTSAPDLRGGDSAGSVDGGQVDTALATPGRPLDSSSRRYMESRFGVDFGAVRIHDDARAAQSAAGIEASAFTVGEHVVFGHGRFDPSSPSGRHLLAHELSHVVQQSRVGGSGRPLQRRSVFESIGILLGTAEGTWEDRELLDYLQLVTKAAGIEGSYDSDNKARAIVARWKASSPGFDLGPTQKVLLIQEMLDGPTLLGDETAIVDLLELSEAVDLPRILGGPGVRLEQLESDIDDKVQRERLDTFINGRFAGGRDAVLAGKVVVIGPAVPAKAPTFGFSPSGLDYRFDSDRPVGELIAWVASFPDADRVAALHHMTGVRRPAMTVRLAQLNDVWRAAAEAAVPDQAKVDAAKAASLAQRQLRYKTEQVILHFLHEAIPTSKADLEAGTSATDPSRAAELKDALSPQVRQVAPGVAAPFRDKLPGQTDTYGQKLTVLLEKIVTDSYQDLVVGKGKAEHSDRSKVHTLAEFQRIGRRAKVDTDAVFRQFAVGDELKADRPGRRGNFHDQFTETERDVAAMTPDQRTEFARKLCFYFFETEGAVRRLNTEHDASPEFGPGRVAKDDAAKAQAAVADAFVAVADNVRRCNEIDRNWPATANPAKKEIFFQMFKGKDDAADRLVLWDVYQTFIHEYLHTLAHKDYRAYANSFRGPANNTLLEGVDSLLTEIVWVSVEPKVTDPALRKAVEGSKATEPPIDVPPPTGQRYGSFTEALHLVDLVGIENLYAAYFLGLVDRIGGTVPAAP